MKGRKGPDYGFNCRSDRLQLIMFAECLFSVGK